MLTILHASDLQFGKPFRPRAAEAFRNLAFDTMPHLIVVSGDLTQRAKGREFKAAWEFLQRLPTVPLVVTPGNHRVEHRGYGDLRRSRPGGKIWTGSSGASDTAL